MLKAIVSDDPKDLELWYFADADLAGDPEDTKSASGGVSCDHWPWNVVPHLLGAPEANSNK